LFPNKGKTHLSEWAVPIGLLWASILAYGVLIPWMGLYADDWPFVYVHHVAGWQGVVAFISWVRPVGAYIFATVTTIFQENFAGYHIFLLLLRWVDGVMLWKLLRMVWPEAKHKAAWAALLFVVFPAFKQQPLALEYSLHFIVLALFFGSLMAMVQAEKQPERFWPYTLAAVALSFNIFFIEYFVGLELLRPVLLWLALARRFPEPGKRLRQVLVRWLPYLAVLAAFVLWRVFVVKFVSYQPGLLDALRADLLGGLAALARTMAKDIFTVTFGTWAQLFTTIPAGPRALALYLALVLAALVPVGLLLLNLEGSPEGKGEQRKREDLEWLAVGAIALIMCGGPFWVTNIPLSLEFPWDRTTLAFMLGVCLVIPALISLLRRPRLQAVVVAALVGLSVGQHFQNANQYRKEWQVFRDFYWQLTWRAPALEEGTIVTLDKSPFWYHVDKFLTPALNYTYAPQSRSLTYPYSMLDFYKFEEKYLPLEDPETPIYVGYGTLKFEQPASHILMVVYDPPGCLRVLTPAEETHLLLSEAARDSLHLSQPERILLNPENPRQPPDFLGGEPEHNWCYTYEKAELARQQGDWKTVVNLGENALNQSLFPRQPSEWLLFVEAHARSGNWDQARKLSEDVLADEFFRPALCDTWKRIQNTALPTAEDQILIEAALRDFNCAP